MTITATFSNGFTDTYKGKRNVKAAWAIIRKSDGKVIASGHSLNRENAAKTSASNLSYACDGYGPVHGRSVYPGKLASLRRYGYEGRNNPAHMKRWMRDQDAARRARIEADHTIEIIDL